MSDDAARCATCGWPKGCPFCARTEWHHASCPVCSGFAPPAPAPDVPGRMSDDEFERLCDIAVPLAKQMGFGSTVQVAAEARRARAAEAEHEEARSVLERMNDTLAGKASDFDIALRQNVAEGLGLIAENAKLRAALEEICGNTCDCWKAAALDRRGEAP